MMLIFVVILTFCGCCRTLDLKKSLRSPLSSRFLMSTATNPSPSASTHQPSLVDDIIRISIPSLAASIAEPALTLVDTYFLNRYLPVDKSVVALAAMAMNGAIFNIIAALTPSLCTGTTSLTSAAQGRQNVSELRKVLRSGMIVSISLGLVVASLLTIFGDSILRVLFRIHGIERSMTLEYLKIRAIAAPSALLNLIIIGFSLGVQDYVAPIIAILTSVCINIIGDYLLIGKFGLGLSGAAAATVLANYFGSFLALGRLLSRYGGRLEASTFIDFDHLKAFINTSGQIFIGCLVNSMTYASASRIASCSSSLSTIHVAAHQVSMQLWWFLSYFSAPLSLVAQGSIPRDIAAGDSNRANNMQKLLLQIGVFVSIACTSLNGILPFVFPSTFTKDSNVIGLVQSLTPQVTLSQFFICMATVMDGIFISRGKLVDYIMTSLLSTASAWIFYARGISTSAGVVGAWNGLLAFSVIRFTYFSLRLGIISRQDKK